MNCRRISGKELFARSSSTTFNFTVDWLSFTFVCGDIRDPFEHPVISQIITSVYPDIHVFIRGNGRYSFMQSYTTDGCLVLYEQKDTADTAGANACHVIFTGQGMKLARNILCDTFDDWLVYIGDHCKIVRCDLALDMFNSPYVDVIKHVFESGDYKSSWRNWTCINSSGNGWTYSLGRRGANTYFRIYDKKAEQVSKDVSCHYDSWLRFELECRDVASWLGSGDKNMSKFFDFYLFILNTHLNVSSLPELNLNFGGVYTPEKAPDTPEQATRRKIDWLRRQVVPTLDTLIDTYGRSFISYILGESNSPFDSSVLAYRYIIQHMPDVYQPKYLPGSGPLGVFSL